MRHLYARLTARTTCDIRFRTHGSEVIFTRRYSTVGSHLARLSLHLSRGYCLRHSFCIPIIYYKSEIVKRVNIFLEILRLFRDCFPDFTKSKPFCEYKKREEYRREAVLPALLLGILYVYQKISGGRSIIAVGHLAQRTVEIVVGIRSISRGCLHTQINLAYSSVGIVGERGVVFVCLTVGVRAYYTNDSSVLVVLISRASAVCAVLDFGELSVLSVGVFVRLGIIIPHLGNVFKCIINIAYRETVSIGKG